MKYKRIHITGASGSGTTTLGRAIAQRLNISHFDSDDYLWLPTDPPYVKIRSREERQKLLLTELGKQDGFVLSGSNSGWGDVLIPHYDLVIFLLLPTDIRVKRLEERELKRFGEEHLFLKKYRDFISWAKKYDYGDISMRSRIMHEEWLKKLPCPILRIEGDYSVDKKIDLFLEFVERK